MIKILIFILKIAIAILPFLLLCLRSSKVNLDKTERSKQFFMPIIAIIFSFIAMFFMKWLNELLISLVEKIPLLIEWFGEFFNESREEKIVEFARKVRDYINSINLRYWMFYISNAIIIGVYLAHK